MTTPILILGSERSGTNLLRAMLQSHSEIASPPPAGFVEVLGSFARNYFTETNEPRFSALIEDINLLTSTHHNPWKMKFSVKQVLNELHEAPSFWSVFRALNDIYARTENAAFWVSKEPGLFRFSNDISNSLSDSKFIYLVRDGRDVAASMLRGNLHAFHIYEAANAWSDTQKLCLSALRELGPSGRLHLIRYEDLIANPHLELSEIMKFLNIPFEEQQLKYHEDANVINHSKKSRFWKNLSNPINSNNTMQYKNYLSRKEVTLFETIARQEMTQLGYKLETKADLKLSHSNMTSYKFISSLKRYIWSFDPRAEARRSRRRFKVIHSIIDRNLMEGGSNSR